MTVNVYDEIQWGVVVNGPDSVLAAKSFSEAVEQCGRINQNLVRLQPEFVGEGCPIIFAQVDKWESIARGPHCPEETNWDEVC